jgi:hypothetical protein
LFHHSFIYDYMMCIYGFRFVDFFPSFFPCSFLFYFLVKTIKKYKPPPSSLASLVLVFLKNVSNLCP